MDYYLVAFKKYATFQGRARRKEYWYFSLFNFLVIFWINIIGDESKYIKFLGAGRIGSQELVAIYFLIAIIPSIAVAVRRMHDVGKSGWFVLIPIYNFILAITEGNKGANDYGPDPKTVANLN